MPDSAPAFDSRRYDCPQCGAPVAFPSSIAIFAVCGHCRSSIVRKDFQLETFGTMAELPPDLSPLQIGTTGHFDGNSFTLIGRLRLHWGEGSWTEWCADFGNGRIGWIAEVMGYFAVSFEKDAPEAARLDDTPHVRQRLKLAGDEWTVTDVKKARCIAAEGALPYAVMPGAERTGCDLTGAGGSFGTLELAGDTRTFYEGHYAQWEELNLSNLRKVPGWEQDAEITRHQSDATNCPNCAAPVNIRAEGLTMSAVCGSCGTVLDTSKPLLTAVDKVVQTTLRIQPVLPIGARGILRGEPWQVIGFMRRKDRWCQWDEFLLFNPWLGFRYLVTFRGHWSLVRILPGHHTNQIWMGRLFPLFAAETVTTTDVLGEFYWRVKAGERAEVRDHIMPPHVLSSEFIKEHNEIVWSGGEYVTHTEVAQAFLPAGQQLPAPAGRYLNEPNPHSQRWQEVRGKFFMALVIYVLIQLLCLGLGSTTKAFTANLAYPGFSASDKTMLTEPFSLSGSSAPLHLTADGAPLPTGGYLALKGDLINADTQQTTPVILPLTNHSGEMEEQTAKATLPAVPAGKYYLRFDPDASGTVPATPVRLQVERGGLFWSNFFLGLFAIALWPLWLKLRASTFEKQRWLESDFSPYASNTSDD